MAWEKYLYGCANPDIALRCEVSMQAGHRARCLWRLAECLTTDEAACKSNTERSRANLGSCHVRVAWWPTTCAGTVYRPLPTGKCRQSVTAAQGVRDGRAHAHLPVTSCESLGREEGESCSTPTAIGASIKDKEAGALKASAQAERTPTSCFLWY